MVPVDPYEMHSTQQALHLVLSELTACCAEGCKCVSVGGEFKSKTKNLVPWKLGKIQYIGLTIDR
jgi:hypothetical protein